MGRPSKRSPEREQAILNALRLGNTRMASAAYAEIHYDTMVAWMGRDPEFLQAVRKAEADAEARFVGRIVQAAAEGTWTAAAWWLERRRPESYARTERVESAVELSGPGGRSIDGLGSLSDHEKRVLRTAIRAHIASERGESVETEDDLAETRETV